MSWLKIPILKFALFVGPITLFSIFFFDQHLATFVRSQGPAELMEAAKVLSRAGQAETYFIVLTLGLLFQFAIRRQWDSRFLLGLSAMAVSGIAVQILKAMFGRERPNLEAGFPALNFHVFEFHHSVHSFPSGHSQAAFAFLAWIRWKFPSYFGPVLIYAILVAASRVILQAHFLSDVIFGSYFGFVSVYLFIYALTRIEQKRL